MIVIFKLLTFVKFLLFEYDFKGYFKKKIQKVVKNFFFKFLKYNFCNINFIKITF